MFPIGFPDFTDDQKSRLNELGVIPEQVHELRHTLAIVRRYVRRRAANNDIAEPLRDVARLASELARKLQTAMVPEAAMMIEEGYWRARPKDEGPTVAMHMCPRLDALTAAARAAIDTVPNGTQARTSVGDPRPIRAIDEALLDGWVKRYGPMACSWIDPDGGEDAVIAAMVKAAEENPPGKPFPARHRPSVSDGSAYREIVGICYAAAGYERYPKRALQAHVKAYNKERHELRASIDDALSKQE